MPNPPDPPRMPADKEVSCVACSKSDLPANFVQCDTCDCWWHFACADVDSSISERAWICTKCEAAPSVSARSSKSNKSGSTVAHELERLKRQQDLERQQADLKLQMKFLKQQQKLLDKARAAEETRSQKSQVSSQAHNRRVRRWVEESSRDGTEEGAVGGNPAPAASPIDHGVQPQGSNTGDPNQTQGRAKSRDRSQSRNEVAELRAQLEQCMKRMEEAFRQQPANTVPQAPPLWVPEPGRMTRDEHRDTGAIPKTYPNPEQAGKRQAPLHAQNKGNPGLFDISPPTTNQNNHPFPQFVPPQSTNPLSNINDRLPYMNGSNRQVFPLRNPPRNPPVNVQLGPTSQQLVARQSLARDLPTFTGDPAEWPIFISSYNYTTEACGYTDGENMIRLQRCLKGSALESVRSRLVIPSTVPQVIEALQMRYGRPELLINALLQKVRSIPAPRSDRLEGLIHYGTAIQALCDHIEAANELSHLSNPTLLQELVAKLPADQKMMWAGYRRCFAGIVDLRTFCAYMQQVVEDATSVLSFESDGNRCHGREQGKEKAKQKGFVNQHASTVEGSSEAAVQKPADKIECVNCSKFGHRIRDCGEFKALSIDNRWRKIRSLGVCQNCLFRHGRRSCRVITRCGIDGCQYRHHPLLHSTQRSSSAVTQVADNHTHRLLTSSVLFRIVPVTLYGNSGQVNTFAFLDEGSSLTLIEGELVNQLGITGRPQPLCLRWTANTSRTEKSSQSVSISISGEGKERKFTIVGARTVECLNLPTQSFHLENAAERFKHLKHLPLKSYQDATPRILIGLDNLRLALPLKVREGDGSGPVAAKTRLGWCVYGQQQQLEQESYSFHVCECTKNEELHETVKQFFAVDEVGAANPILSAEDQRAQELLEQTTRRVGDRYETGLLWRKDHVELPESYPMALSRMKCLERRMERDSTLKQKIQQQVRDYVIKGYAHVASDAELERADPRRVWYLPLGAVTNPKKPEKVRIIWDAAAKVDGLSLNSHLLKGPDQLTFLPAVLFRFRQFHIAVSADIAEMFHQILMIARDKQSLRFLFRFDPTLPPIVYVMDVATFGATCSPASAQFVKNLNAKEHSQQYPRAAQRIVDNHYVDDYLDSFGDVEEAKQIAAEVRLVHRNGGFVLRNWNANSDAVLEFLGEPGIDRNKNINLVDKEHTERVLGMLWMPATDELCFSTQMNEEVRTLIETSTRPTKRQVLRCVMTLFDPLGLLATFLIHGKVLIQELWRTGINWDENIKDAELNRWREWVQMIQFISTVRIPRCYFEAATSSTYENAQLHVFVDASPAAYCCVVYLRVMDSEGNGQCSLVAAKAKVAPLKPMSIPRLELQGCVLGTRMLKFVQENHTIPITKRYLWTDNTTALSWIRSDPRNYRPFVAHRVGEILETTSVDEWRYVPSLSNPADEGTKWGKGPYFSTDSRWFAGPQFLRYPEDDWPTPPELSSIETEEIRPSVLFHFPYEPVIQFERFPKWERLHRTVAYVLRFMNNINGKRRKMCGELQQEELQAAEAVIMKQVQWQVFPDEMTILTKNKSAAEGEAQPIPKSSSLYQLVPALDEDGVMRQSGRIGAAKHASYNLRHPVILPRKSEVTTLVVDEYHRKYKHANPETVVNEIRQHFEIPRLRTVVRRCSRECRYCILRRARPYIPPMAPLPAARLAACSRPFSFVGLDYFGPLLVKQGRASVKRWIALFTCLTVRAVHLEVVHSLTTSSCVSAVRRFIGRRGAPVEFYSDNGTNFQGAERLLREQIEQGLSATFTSSKCKWLFIPPGAPHMGGAWERMVQSVKAAMGEAYGDGKLDEEGLGTLVVEAESVVNARPLTYLPLDSEESEALTPNHFLLGSSSGIKEPGRDIRYQQRNLQKTWVEIQQQLDIFWKRWLKEYLPVIRRQPKWFEEAAREIKDGDLVLITDDGRRSEWTRGRVEQAIRGPDGRVRQAIVRTKGGSVRRPVTKIALLDVGETRAVLADGKMHPAEDVAASLPIYHRGGESGNPVAEGDASNRNVTRCHR